LRYPNDPAFIMNIHELHWISWEAAEALVGVNKKPVQSVIITVERKKA
jgi:hypothetical protein